MSRATREASGYLVGFPHLAGIVHAFCGDDHAHRDVLQCLSTGNDWTEHQRPTDLVLTPAACYPVYSVLSQRGPVPDAGCLVSLQSFCFRREPATEAGRLQTFRMHEFVRAGTPEQVLAFREL